MARPPLMLVTDENAPLLQRIDALEAQVRLLAMIALRMVRQRD